MPLACFGGVVDARLFGIHVGAIDNGDASYVSLSRFFWTGSANREAPLYRFHALTGLGGSDDPGLARREFVGRGSRMPSMVLSGTTIAP